MQLSSSSTASSFARFVLSSPESRALEVEHRKKLSPSLEVTVNEEKGRALGTRVVAVADGVWL